MYDALYTEKMPGRRIPPTCPWCSPKGRAVRSDERSEYGVHAVLGNLTERKTRRLSKTPNNREPS